MIAEAVSLRFAAATVVRLRELTGRDERAVSGAATADAIALLDALLEGVPGRAADLTASDRDRLLAAVYSMAFGDTIQSTLTCQSCDSPFELDFSLRQLTDSLGGDAGDWVTVGDRIFQTPEGARFRLPTGRDELAIAGLSEAEAEDALLERCVQDGWPGGAAAFQDELDRLAPLLDLELTAPCAECGHSHTVRFDIQSYLLGALLGEGHRLATEIHRLASAYGWGLEEILSLTRSERRQLAALIENERTPQSRWPR